MITNRRFVEPLRLRETICSPTPEARICGELLRATASTARAIAQSIDSHTIGILTVSVSGEIGYEEYTKTSCPRTPVESSDSQEA